MSEQLGSVHSLLVTGSNDQLIEFHLSVCFALNVIDRRKQTIRYTCFDKHLSVVIDVAKAAGVTLQRIEKVNTVEVYPVLVRGNMLGWRPLATVALGGSFAKATVTGETKRNYRCKLEEKIDTPTAFHVPGETVSLPKPSVQFISTNTDR